MDIGYISIILSLLASGVALTFSIIAIKKVSKINIKNSPNSQNSSVAGDGNSVTQKK